MYKIAIRTYKRSDSFVEKTYKMLSDQTDINLSECLYLFVANNDEKVLYEKALDGKSYKDIIVGIVGIKEITDFILDYFGDNQEIFFFDDDLFGFFEYPGPPLSSKIIKDSKNLHTYLIDGFKTIKEENISTFAFKSMQNALFVGHKPFKEIRPHYLVGSAWGAITNKKLLETMYGHNEDMERTAKVIDLDGGSLVYNWAGTVTHINNVGQGLNEGGMQSSGDRGDKETRIDFTKKIAFELAEKTSMTKYFNGPFFSDKLQAWDWKMKSITSLRKYNIKEKSWKNYFGKE